MEEKGEKEVVLLMNFRGVGQFKDPGIYDFGRAVLVIGQQNIFKVWYEDDNDEVMGAPSNTQNSGAKYSYFFSRINFTLIETIVDKRKIIEAHLYLPRITKPKGQGKLGVSLKTLEQKEIIDNLIKLIQDPLKINVITCSCTRRVSPVIFHLLGLHHEEVMCGGKDYLIKKLSETGISWKETKSGEIIEIQPIFAPCLIEKQTNFDDD